MTDEEAEREAWERCLDNPQRVYGVDGEQAQITRNCHKLGFRAGLAHERSRQSKRMRAPNREAAMGSDVIERWERAKYDPCNGPAGMSDLKHAGDDVASELKATRDLLNRANRYSDQIAAELEQERERVRRVEALLSALEDVYIDPDQEMIPVRELRAALTAPASDEGGE